MEMQSEVIVHGIKESAGEYEGRAFSSCTFHCEVDLKENGAGRSLGRVTRPFKLPDAKEFDKWAHLANAFPIRAKATFSMEATRDDGAKLTLLKIAPIVVDRTPAAPATAARTA